MRPGSTTTRTYLDQIPVTAEQRGRAGGRHDTGAEIPDGPRAATWADAVRPRGPRDALIEIDAIILRGYGLPEPLQLKVLSYLRHADRPVAVDFKVSALESRLAAEPPGTEDPVEAWDSYNDRRAFLIDKELNEGLTQEEQRELKRLQDAADSYLDRFEPLPSRT